ncbi:MAG: FAD-dependent oxidoreductase [Betaproteobacteria bacterium]|nr:FAD-dependent oxidoreductase [Betaproteobacteria bacterium]
MRRRDFLAACGAAGCAAALPGCVRRVHALPAGKLGGGDHGLGHRLRQADFPPPTATIDIPVLIVGAGVAGLSAAWRLSREAPPERPRFLVLELENAPGGNARHGENAVSRYPLGAHYLPLPNCEARAVRALLAELGVLGGDPDREAPSYDERYLCHPLQERLYRLGIWQEGIVPRLGVPRAELTQQERFFARMAQLREARDAVGRKVFALPLAYGSDTPPWAELDRLSMHDWMMQEGFAAPSLHWYVNYACRDDYGTDYRQVSAWAGIHYFTCRTGKGATPEGKTDDGVLTAPEGNGWLVDGLRGLIARALPPGASWLRTQQAVYALRQDAGGCEADVWDAASQTSLRVHARHVIWSAPLFLLPHLASGLPDDLVETIAGITHAPWLVANLTLDAPLPNTGAGAGVAWDNVLQDSPALGYVLATHQNIRLAPGPTVLTYYYALAEYPPAVARQILLDRSHEEWAEFILNDLSRAHGGLRERVSQLDIFRHGHAMARPLPGFRDPTRRQRLTAGWDRVRFAHADVSGLSLFEEANYHGVRAAEEILAAQGRLRTRLI